VYIDLGCLYCHSQQVRPEGFGADIDRGWGDRRSVARDYMFDAPPLLGTMRTGPDLASIAVRQPSREWHYLHLYEPTLTSPGSNMAPFPFLFERFDPEELRVGEGRDEPPDDAVRVPGPDGTDEGGYWIVPTDRARALVDYLLSLDQSYDVPEVR
jgi:cytochrome c oxidase cbb3-type subunit 2